MFIVNKTELKKILVDEFTFKPYQADLFLSDYPPIYEPLVPAIQRWLMDRNILDISIEGLTIQDVIRKRQCNFLMAIREMNRLLDPALTSDIRKLIIEDLRNSPIIW